jgi:hypothetical protein
MAYATKPRLSRFSGLGRARRLLARRAAENRLLIRV